jgi:tetratricopeptide (TPR) repeat protein
LIPADRVSGLKTLCILTLLSSALLTSSAAGQAQTAGTQDAAALMREGLDLARQGQFAQADVRLQQAQALEPRNPEVLTALAKVKARMGEVPAATELFRQVVAITPRSADAHLNLGIILADERDLEGALQEVTKSLQLAPNQGPAHLNKARILADLHRLPEARTEFTAAARLLPSNPDAFFYWALTERESGNYVKEASLLETVTRLQPGNERAHVLLCQSLTYQTKQAEAVACWKKTLEVDPDSKEALYGLSRALRTTDPSQSKDLQRRFDSEQQKDKADDAVKGLGNQAYLAMNQHNWPLAISTLRHAISLCPQCDAAANLHKDLGLALCQNGDLPAGREELRTALRLNPGDPDTLKALSVVGDH